MKRRSVPVQWLVIGLLLGFSACAAPKVELTSIWKDAAYQGGYLKKILVVSAARKVAARSYAENEFVTQMEGRGTEAVASYKIIPSEKMMDKAFIAEKITGMGIDGILVMRVLYTMTAAPPLPKPPTWHEFYSDSFGYGYDVSAPRISQGKTFARMEVNLYEARTERLIWSASSDLQVKDEPKEETRLFVSELIKRLRLEGLTR